MGIAVRTSVGVLSVGNFSPRPVSGNKRARGGPVPVPLLLRVGSPWEPERGPSQPVLWTVDGSTRGIPLEPDVPRETFYLRHTPQVLQRLSLTVGDRVEPGVLYERHRVCHKVFDLA